MREIKFRIWDYKHNMFYTWEEISSGKLRNRLEYFFGNPNFVIQQYIGINDINDKPIFDGDLVELHTSHNDGIEAADPGYLDCRGHCGLYEIYFDRYYKLREIKKNWFHTTSCTPAAQYNILKVVGNILQNKSLLSK